MCTSNLFAEIESAKEKDEVKQLCEKRQRIMEQSTKAEEVKARAQSSGAFSEAPLKQVTDGCDRQMDEYREELKKVGDKLEAKSEEIWNKCNAEYESQKEGIGFAVLGTPEKPKERWAGQERSNFFISDGE